MFLFNNNLQLYLYRDAYEIDENDEYYIKESWEYSIPRLDKVYTVMINKEILEGKYYSRLLSYPIKVDTALSTFYRIRQKSYKKAGNILQYQFFLLSLLPKNKKKGLWK